MHREPVSAFLQMLNKDVSRHSEGEYNVELHPTYRAMIDLMYAVGFTRVMEVVASTMPINCRRSSTIVANGGVSWASNR